MSEKNVLIATYKDDIHGIAVRHQIAKLYGESVKCVIFDTATYPIASTTDWRSENNELRVRFGISSPLADIIGNRANDLLVRRDQSLNQTMDIESITGVWWRRARNIQIHPDIKIQEFQSFCSRISVSCLRAALVCCPVHNDIVMEERASLKPFQLKMAQSCGLKIPRTLITSNSDLARDFSDSLRREGREVIFKHAASATNVGLPTRILQEQDIDRLDTLRYAHTIFQERIQGGLDLRLVVIGRRVFAAEWRAEIPNPDLVDIRLGEGVRMWETQCPNSIYEPLLLFHEKMGLTFGVYDFKVDQNGTPFFLEVNPSGQWLDMELQAGHPISGTWARVLVEGLGNEHDTQLEPLSEQKLDLVSKPDFTYTPPSEWVQIV